MRVPLSWLREWVEDLPDADELAERLTMAGLEVEGVQRAEPSLVQNLVVVQIDRREPHPNADRLSLCTVTDGEGSGQVVCGATNMAAGDLVVLARPGARLPDGRKIKKAKIRGVASEGMLCSAAELGVSDDHVGIMILPSDVTVGTSAAALLGLDDDCLEIAVTPNRGDCLSVRGLAREIAAVCGLKATMRAATRVEPPRGVSRVSVTVEAPDACPSYCGIEVRGIRIGTSPPWLAARLTACGMRPINNVVDATNFVLLELGQPTHAFDAELLAGPSIYVREVRGDVDIETLDGQTRRLVDGDLAICDESGPVAIAGVMGGARTAVHGGTRDIFIESAMFRAGAVRATSRRLGLVSESSYRFERGVDPATVDQALVRVAELVAELAGGEIVGGMAAAGPGTEPPAAIRLRGERLERILGTPIALDDAGEILASLGAEVAALDGELRVSPPSHRSDLVREIDLIEEVARIRGYDSFPAEAPRLSMPETTVPRLYGSLEDLRASLAASGLTESVALSFCSDRVNRLFRGLHDDGQQPVALRNPLRSDAGQLRRSLLGPLLETLGTNRRNGAEVVDLFAIGTTFAQTSQHDSDAGRGTVSMAPRPLIAEVLGVAGILWGPRRGRGPGSAGPATFWDGKGVVERLVAAVAANARLCWRPCESRQEFHPRAAATIELGESVIGYLGMIHPDAADELEIPRDICMFEVDSQKLVAYAPGPRELRTIPRYPSSRRDVSLLVTEELLAGDVTAAIEGLAEPLVERVSVFDEYAGEGVGAGRRALAFSIVYRAADRTLTDDEVTEVHDRVVGRVVEELGVEVRA